MASSESGQKGLLGRTQKAPAAPGCPINFQQAAQFEFLPQRGAQQGKEAGEAVRLLTEPRAEAQQHIGQEEAEAWRSLPRTEKLNPRYRKEFRAVGYEFGQSMINVIRCPACPNDAKPDTGRLHTKAALEELLGDDEDGLVATFEDYRL